MRSVWVVVVWVCVCLGQVSLCAARGAAVAHCPLSNGFFAGGVLPVKRFLTAGVTVGLGTDVAGG